ncbi:uncharacterized protein LOC130823332 [Amaranthus tricolor]|uniref:uncharacterized protein LOC130823332 n=1 Tax=Amaranthus tricolor TaxID=29722 RepID=UPI002588CD66|nr:uncharacterized protein LOC130823332 [Amaranthus tricolor]
MKTTQEHQNSYDVLRRRLEEFEIGDRGLLRVPSMLGWVLFGAREKLSPRSIGPYEILERLKWCRVISCFRPRAATFSYVEQPVHILSTKVRSTRRNDINMLKVLWANHEREVTTYETELSMREKYPHLFQVSKSYGDVTSLRGVKGDRNFERISRKVDVCCQFVAIGTSVI